MIGILLAATRPFARMTEQNVADAGKALGQAFADPTRGVEELDKRLGNLDARTQQLIRSYQE